MAIAGTKGPKYKKFDTYEDALDFIREWGDEQTIADAEKAAENDGITVQPSMKTFSNDEKSDDDSDDDLSVESDDTSTKDTSAKDTKDTRTKVYTDGSSLGNGTAGSVAGVGVYFGPNDPRYVVLPRRDGSDPSNDSSTSLCPLRPSPTQARHRRN
ncbi:hypothetical protein LX36DRAFT_94691 [Colletotrichum falcatum]|nr:hypothetical protein LX36DRAFT_94691 [Colletotrichum falcatum]